MRRIGEAFYGRQAAYEAAIAAHDRQSLAAALARNVFGQGSGETAAGADRLAAYALEALCDLEAQASDALRGAKIDFPDPVTIAPAVPNRIELPGDS
jgi:cytochrome b pre-mRNA-processing protein 3